MLLHHFLIRTLVILARTNENFQINMSLSLEGIGAELTTEDEYTKVNREFGGPADLHGALKVEDKIVGVGQENEEMVDVIGWRLDEVVELYEVQGYNRKVRRPHNQWYQNNFHCKGQSKT